jgi:hypothetical protein
MTSLMLGELNTRVLDTECECTIMTLSHSELLM